MKRWGPLQLNVYVRTGNIRGHLSFLRKVGDKGYGLRNEGSDWRRGVAAWHFHLQIFKAPHIQSADDLTYDLPALTSILSSKSIDLNKYFMWLS